MAGTTPALKGADPAGTLPAPHPADIHRNKVGAGIIADPARLRRQRDIAQARQRTAREADEQVQ
jgi:hypothetical protein